MTKSNSEDTDWDPWRTYAEKKGVSTKTLDRWVEAGIPPAAKDHLGPQISELQRRTAPRRRRSHLSHVWPFGPAAGSAARRYPLRNGQQRLS